MYRLSTLKECARVWRFLSGVTRRKQPVFVDISLPYSIEKRRIHHRLEFILLHVPLLSRHEVL